MIVKLPTKRRKLKRRIIRTGRDCDRYNFKSVVSLSRGATLLGERNLPLKSETLRDREMAGTGLVTGSI